MIKKRNLAQSLQDWIQYEVSVVSPIFGKIYYVDGTNGSDYGKDGLSLANAFATVQKAITVQTAETEDMGDLIWVLPGTYSENLSGALTNMTLRGLPVGTGSRSIIRSVAGHNAWHGNLSSAIIRDIEFQSNATDDAAIFLVKTIIKSTFHNVIFRSRQVGSIGLQIGGQTSGASETWEYMEDSLVSDCTFTCDTEANDLYCGINFGVYADDDSNAAQRLFQRSRITGCNIQAQKRGINMLTGNSNNQGSMIDNNFITGNLGPAGPSEYGIRHNDSEFMVMIANNFIKSGATAISGFSAYNLLGNIVAGGDAIPVYEYTI